MGTLSGEVTLSSYLSSLCEPSLKGKNFAPKKQILSCFVSGPSARKPHRKSLNIFSLCRIVDITWRGTHWSEKTEEYLPPSATHSDVIETSFCQGMKHNSCYSIVAMVTDLWCHLIIREERVIQCIVYVMRLSNYKWDTPWNSYYTKDWFCQTYNSFSNNLIIWARLFKTNDVVS